MINVRAIANATIQPINSNRTVTVLRSTGYTIGAGRKQVPTYAAPVTGPAQLQPMSGDDLKQIDGLNVQGTLQAIYLRGALAQVVRPNETGGDIVQIDGSDWLVVKVLEAWPTWTKAVIVLQGGI